MGKSKSSKKHMGISPKKHRSKRHSKKYRASPSKDICRTVVNMFDNLDLCDVLSRTLNSATMPAYIPLFQLIKEKSYGPVLGDNDQIQLGEDGKPVKTPKLGFLAMLSRVAVKVVGGHVYSSPLEIARELGISKEYTDKMSKELTGLDHVNNPGEQSKDLVSMLRAQSAVEALSSEHLPSVEEAYKSIMSPVQVDIHRR
jgi:hypothetical protein